MPTMEQNSPREPTHLPFGVLLQPIHMHNRLTVYL